MKPRSFLIAAVLITASLPAIYQIITPGYFPIHDDTQVVRVQQMYKSLSAGQFPVRWVPDLGYGYGYPIYNFYNPLPYYFGAAFMFLGLDALAAAKIMFVFPIILSGLTMYLFSRYLLPRWGAFLAAILYVYAPYHAVQIYIRGAVAEYWAYAILPLVFYAIWKNKIILAGISLAVLITSHNLTAFMSIPFLALAVLLQDHKNYKGYKWQGITAFLLIGLGLSAFFWLPAIFEANKTLVSQMVFEKFDPPALHLIKPFQLWSGQWGWGGSSPGTDDGLSLQLGKVHLLGSLAAIVILLYFYIAKKTIKQFNNLTIFSIISLVFSVFMLLPASQPIWNSLPLLSYIQFPWRFLTFASLFSSILAAWVIWIIIKVIKNPFQNDYFTTNVRSDVRNKLKKQKNSFIFSLLFCSDRTSLVKSIINRSIVGFETTLNNIKSIKLLTDSLFLVSCFLFLVSSLKFFQPQFKYPTSAEELTSRERILWEVSRRSDEYLPVSFIRPLTLEEALRVDNPLNQKLVDELKQPTPVRRLGNTISAITIIGMIGFAINQTIRLRTTRRSDSQTVR